MKIFIYSLSDPDTKEVRYIGKTCRVDMRIQEHINCANRGVDTYVYNWIRKVIAKDKLPIIQIVEECTASNWKDREIFWINKYGRRLTNTQSGGQGISHGASFSISHKKNLSIAASNKFRDNPAIKLKYIELYGKLSKSQIEEIFTLYHNKNISVPILADKFGSTISSISFLLRGRRYSHITVPLVLKYGKPSKSVTCKNSVIIFKKIGIDYLAGMSIDQIITKYKFHRVTVFRAIARSTGKTYQKHEFQRLRSKIIEEFNNGNSRGQIANILSCDYGLITKTIKKHLCQEKKQLM